MFKCLPKSILCQFGIWLVCTFALLAVAFVFIGAVTIFSDRVLGYLWVYGALGGGALVLLGGFAALVKLNALAAPETKAPEAAKQINLKPIAYTIGGPAFTNRAQTQPPFVSLTVRKESRSYATQNQ